MGPNGLNSGKGVNMRRTSILFAATAAALLFTAGQADAASCRDASGKFTKCPTATAAATRCKDASGKFAKCSAPGATPVAASTKSTTTTTTAKPAAAKTTKKTTKTTTTAAPH